MAEPTAKELELLPVFRKRLEDLKLTGERNGDYFLLRWLRARELDLDQAEDMLRKSLAWREENDIDSVLNWEPPEFIPRDYPVEIVGVDNDNSPVMVIPFGRFDYKAIVQLGYKEVFIRYFDQVYERIEAKCREKKTKDGAPVTQFVVVWDAAKLTMRALASLGVIDMMLEITRRFEANHPETLKAAYVINASKVFSFLFGLIKPLLSQRTFGKVRIFDKNEEKWKKALAEAIPKDQLPTALGGTRVVESIEKILKVADLKIKDDEEEDDL